MLFKSILFRFDLVLFKYYFLLELFYFNCKLLYFRNKYSKDLVLEQKKRRIGADSCQKYEDLIQNILCKDSCQKYEDLITKKSCAKNLKILCKNITKWRAPFYPFAAIASLTKAAYFSISDLEPMVSCATI